MVKKFAQIVIKTTLRIRTSAGSAEHTNPTTVMKCKSGGVVVRKEKILPVASFLSMNVKKTKTRMILKRRRSNWKSN